MDSFVLREYDETDPLIVAVAFDNSRSAKDIGGCQAPGFLHGFLRPGNI
jgi:hypothetical protein